jgi:hypothetical protein
VLQRCAIAENQRVVLEGLIAQQDALLALGMENENVKVKRASYDHPIDLESFWKKSEKSTRPQDKSPSAAHVSGDAQGSAHRHQPPGRFLELLSTP